MLPQWYNILYAYMMNIESLSFMITKAATKQEIKNGFKTNILKNNETKITGTKIQLST